MSRGAGARGSGGGAWDDGPPGAGSDYASTRYPAPSGHDYGGGATYASYPRHASHDQRHSAHSSAYPPPPPPPRERYASYDSQRKRRLRSKSPAESHRYDAHRHRSTSSSSSVEHERQTRSKERDRSVRGAGDRGRHGRARRTPDSSPSSDDSRSSSDRRHKRMSPHARHISSTRRSPIRKNPERPDSRGSKRLHQDSAKTHMKPVRRRSPTPSPPKRPTPPRHRERSITPPKSYKTRVRSVSSSSASSSRSLSSGSRSRSRSLSPTHSRGSGSHSRRSGSRSRRSGSRSRRSGSRSPRSGSHSRRSGSRSRRSSLHSHRSGSHSVRSGSSTSHSRSRSRSRRKNRTPVKEESERSRSGSRARSDSDTSSRGHFSGYDRKRYFRKLKEKQAKESEGGMAEDTTEAGIGEEEAGPSAAEKPVDAIEPAGDDADAVQYGDPPPVDGVNFEDLPPPPDELFSRPRRPGAPPVCIRNDGSFLEMFKRMQEETKRQEEAQRETAPAPDPPKKPALPFIGKRRGGRVLKTGVVKKVKAVQESSEGAPKDAWSLYMQEVKKYRETSCEEERKTRPLVK